MTPIHQMLSTAINSTHYFFRSPFLWWRRSWIFIEQLSETIVVGHVNSYYVSVIILRCDRTADYLIQLINQLP